jgi:CBS domain-containing protein
MRCSQIMKSSPHCLGITSAALEAARVMRDENVGFLPVCDASGKVVGTVTDRDLAVRVLAEQLPVTTEIGEVMTEDVVCCQAADDVEKAQELMAKNQKSRIVCLDEQGRLAGVISLSDLAKNGDASRTLRQIAAREAHA